MLRLRPYQAEAVERVFASWASGKQRPLVVLPTGGGKTQCAEAITDRFKAPLALVHTTPLETQTRRRLPRAGVATIQAMLAQGESGERLRRQASAVDVVFLDEAHHIVSDEWSKVLGFFPQARVFGVTATPVRADKTPLGDVFDDMVLGANYSDLLSQQYLVHCDVWRSEVSRKKQKKDKVRPDGIKAYFAHGGLRDDGSARAGIMFATSIARANECVTLFEQSGLRAAVITAKTSESLRQYRFGAFERGELDVLVSPMALAEGFDSPRAEVCILERSADSLGAFLQMVGRVLRPAPNKARALLIDCTNATERWGMPTDDRVYSLDKGIELLADVQAAEAEAEELEKEKRVAIEWERIASEYRLVSNQLLSQWRAEYAREVNTGAPRNSARWSFKRKVGIDLPPFFSGKYANKCAHCRSKTKVGENIFWSRAEPGERASSWHEVCYFEQLERDILDGYVAKSHSATQVDWDNKPVTKHNEVPEWLLDI
jgi:superfamily II DNA or RNA helicase